MNIVDIRTCICTYLRLNDLLSFLSVDHIGNLMNQDHALWKNKALLYNISNTCHINKLKRIIKFYENTQDQVNFIIQSKLKTNIINDISSFEYLNYIMKKINLSSNQYNKLCNIVNYNNLKNKYLTELYVYTQNDTYNIEFKVPKIYNLNLKSYTWYGISEDEIKLFIFNFIYYHSII